MGRTGKSSSRHPQAGMSLMEMIGVLGVIAVLAAMIVPKVFDVIMDSKVEALAVAIQTYETAVTNYYTDIGTVLPLNQEGIPQVETTGDSSVPRSLAARLTLVSSDPLVLTTNLWPKFRGPYLEQFVSQRPPELGVKMFLPTGVTVPLGTVVTGTNLGWDLNGDDGKSDLPSGVYVAYFKLEGLSEEHFLKLDQIIDPLVSATPAEKKLRGRAKWDPAHDGTLLVYLAHR
ncbi:MAG: type II secretion system protein [Nitrospirae bacterium]|nr:MAG: type II secretion system protein [Nitrospirota bacterium]